MHDEWSPLIGFQDVHLEMLDALKGIFLPVSHISPVIRSHLKTTISFQVSSLKLLLASRWVVIFGPKASTFCAKGALKCSFKRDDEAAWPLLILNKCSTRNTRKGKALTKRNEMMPRSS